MKRLCVQCADSKYINVEADKIERDGETVSAYSKGELVAVIYIGSVNHLYLTDVKEGGKA